MSHIISAAALHAHIILASWRTRYGVSFVNICRKIYRVMTPEHRTDKLSLNITYRTSQCVEPQFHALECPLDRTSDSSPTCVRGWEAQSQLAMYTKIGDVRNLSWRHSFISFSTDGDGALRVHNHIYFDMSTALHCPLSWLNTFFYRCFYTESHMKQIIVLSLSLVVYLQENEACVYVCNNIIMQ